MSGVPSEFKMPDFSPTAVQSQWGKTQYNDVLKPVAGSVGAMHVKFAQVKEYDGALSVKEDKECYRSTDVCFFKTDKFSLVPLKVGSPGQKVLGPDGRPQIIGKVACELSKEQSRQLAPLFDAYQRQAGSLETSIREWDAIGDADKAFLEGLGYFSVEQLNAMPVEQRHKLGPGGDELWQQSERAMKAKRESDKTEELRKELELVRLEREAMAKKNKELEAQLYAKHEEIAKAGKSKKEAASVVA